MANKIVVNKQELIVEEFYPFRYDYGKGKEVLRIKISEDNHSFEEIKALDNTGAEECPVIEYWIDDEKKNEYVGYNADFSSNYLTENDSRIFSIEITRKGATELALDAVSAQSTNNQAILEKVAVQTTSNTKIIDELSVILTELSFGAEFKGGIV